MALSTEPGSIKLVPIEVPLGWENLASEASEMDEGERVIGHQITETRLRTLNFCDLCGDFVDLTGPDLASK